MNLTVFDDVVPAVQADLPRQHTAAHHGELHQAAQLQQDGTLLGAAQGFRARLHRQHRLAPQVQPALQVFCFGRHIAVQGLDGTAVAVATDDDAADLQAEHGKFNRRRRTVVALGAVVRWHESPHVAHQKQFPRPGTGQHVRHQPRVGAADEQRLGVLALGHQVLKTLLVQRKVVGLEMPQPRQELVAVGLGVGRGRGGHVHAYCTRGESAASRAICTSSASPASRLMYWCSARARDCMASRRAIRSCTSAYAGTVPARRSSTSTM